MSEPREQLLQQVAEAASSPAFRVTAAGTGLAGFGEWVISSHGLATIGLLITVLGFLLNLWQVARRYRLEERKDQREQVEFEERLKSMRESRGLPPSLPPGGAGAAQP